MHDSGSQEKTNGVAQRMQSRPTLIEIIDILFRWKRFIAINVLAITIAAVGVSLMLPKWYKAKASLLPPKEKDMLSSLGVAGSVLRGIGGGGSAMRALGGGQTGYNFFAILNSRTALEAAVHKFDLMAVYGIDDSSMEATIHTLEKNVSFEEGNNEDITIEVIDRDSQRAADLANYFVEVLNEMSTRLGTQEAHSNRQFIERQVEKERTLLKDAEDSLQSYQERVGTIISPDQAGALVPIAELYATKAKREVELAVIKRTVSNDNAEVHQKEIELKELDRKLSAFPGIGIQSIRLYRDVVIHQKILEYLMPMLEQAKIDEQKDIPVLLVLDRAVVPEKKFRPQRTLIVFLTFSLALLGSCILTLVMQGLNTIHETQGPFASRASYAAKLIARVYKVV